MATYTRNFKHSDWIDNYDRVKAGGPDGFNVHFHAIEAEFDTIGSTLNALGVQVQAPVTIALPPILYSYAGSQPWGAVSFGVTSGPNLGTFTTFTATSSLTDAWGTVPLSLPNGVKLTTLSVLGSGPSGTTMTTDLYQERHSDGSIAPSLATVTGFTSLTIPTPVVFSGDVNLYYLVAHVKPPIGQTAVLRGFSITYQPA